MCDGFISKIFGGEPKPAQVVQAAPASVVTPLGDTGVNTAAVARKRRSLLSSAGAIGDVSRATTGAGAAIGKATLGA